MTRSALFRAIWITAFKQYGRRYSRLFKLPFYNIRPDRSFMNRCFDAPFEWILLGVDLCFIPEIYCSLGILVKRNIRGLTEDESRVLQVFELSDICLDAVHMDNKAWLGPSWSSFAYVTFYCINFFDKLSPITLAHEVVHIWQFQKFGSVYIYHALMSQWSRSGYDYGGFEFIQDARERSLDLLRFNFEQQGDILADYFRLLVMQKRGVPGLEHRLEIYHYILKPLRVEGLPSVRI